MIALPNTLIRNFVYNELTKARINELLMMHQQLDLDKGHYFQYLGIEEIELPHIDIAKRHDTFLKRDDIFCVPGVNLIKEFDYLLVFSRWQRVGRELRRERVSNILYLSMELDLDELRKLRNVPQAQEQTATPESGPSQSAVA